MFPIYHCEANNFRYNYHKISLINILIHIHTYVRGKIFKPVKSIKSRTYLVTKMAQIKSKKNIKTYSRSSRIAHIKYRKKNQTIKYHLLAGPNAEGQIWLPELAARVKKIVFYGSHSDHRQLNLPAAKNIYQQLDSATCSRSFRHTWLGQWQLSRKRWEGFFSIFLKIIWTCRCNQKPTVTVAQDNSCAGQPPYIYYIILYYI